MSKSDYTQNLVDSCVEKCPDGLFTFEANKQCLSKCSDGFITDKVNMSCYNDFTLCKYRYN